MTKAFSILFLSIICQISLLLNQVKCLKIQSIVGGNYAHQYHLKYQVSIHVNGMLKCGGGIVSDQSVLTAAHCVHNEVTGEFLSGHITVGIDIHALTADAIRYEVDIVYLLNTFESIRADNVSELGYTRDDILVIKIHGRFILKEHNGLKQLKIPGQHSPILGYMYIVAGHGVHEKIFTVNEGQHTPTEVGKLDGKLRFAEVLRVTNHDCQNLYANPIFSSNMCAKIISTENNLYPVGVCDGDSGSPLVYNDEIVYGVLIGGPPNCNENERPSIYAKVTHYSIFINNAIKGIKRGNMRAAQMIMNSAHEFVFIDI